MSDMLAAVTRHLKPYDSALEDNLSMYDNLPYKRDSDLCNVGALGLVSGNVLKFYRCNYTEPYEVKNMDDIISYKIAEVFQNTSSNENQQPPEEEITEDNLAEALIAENYTPMEMDEDLED